MNNKKIIIGITAEGSVNLLLGQLAYFKSLGYKTYLLAPYSERSAKLIHSVSILKKIKAFRFYFLLNILNLSRLIIFSLQFVRQKAIL
jgi:hypothetical protein